MQNLIGDLVEALMEAWQQGRGEVEIRREFRSILETALSGDQERLAEAEALLEKVLKAKERLRNGAEEWSEISAFLAKQ